VPPSGLLVPNKLFVGILLVYLTYMARFRNLNAAETTISRPQLGARIAAVHGSATCLTDHGKREKIRQGREVTERLGASFTWPVVGPVGGGPSSAVGRAKDTSTLPRSSRWAARKPRYQKHPPPLRTPQDCGLLPNKACAAIRAEMKSNSVTAVGIALVDLPLPIEPHLLFRKSCAEMESATGAALARLTVAQIHPIRFTRGNYSKRAAVALPGLFHRPSPSVAGPLCPMSSAPVEAQTAYLRGPVSNWRRSGHCGCFGGEFSKLLGCKRPHGCRARIP
jgi:hypothetical protein